MITKIRLEVIRVLSNCFRSVFEILTFEGGHVVGKYNISELIKIFQKGFVENSSQENAGRLLLNAVAIDAEVDVSADMISSLVKQKIDVQKKIRDATTKVDCLPAIVEYFEEDVIPDLNPILIDDLCNEIKMLLLTDSSVSVAKQDQLISLLNENQITDFLANAFVYALHKENKIDKKKQVAVKEDINSGAISQHSALIIEFHNRCPLCQDALTKTKNDQVIEKYRILKIYPDELINSATESHLLLIKKSLQNNQVALCRDCAENHLLEAKLSDCIFLFDLKQSFLQTASLRGAINNFVLEIEIKEVIQALVKIESLDGLQHLSLDPLNVKQKIKAKNVILLDEITRDVLQYYRFIEESFAQFEKFNLIASEVQATFYKLDAANLSQFEIKRHLAEWILNKSKLANNAINLRVCHIIVAFFVQNCEVFYEISE